RTHQVWLGEAERVKRMLNEQEVCAVKYQCSNQLFVGGKKRIFIKRDEFFAASASIVRAAIECAGIALRHARLTWRGLRNVLCVGGSSRLKHLHAALEQTAGRTLNLDELDVDSAIARGAAAYGHQLAQHSATLTSALSGPIPSVPRRAQDS